MTKPFRSLLLFSSLFILTACGGGGGGDTPASGGGTNPPPPTSSQKIADAQNYSASELVSAAKQLVSSRYTGTRTAASIDLQLAEQVFIHLFNDAKTEIPSIGDEPFTEQLDNNGNIDINFACFYGGTARYVGNLNSNMRGNISITYSNCEHAGTGYTLTGSVALTVSELTESAIDLTYYFDNLRWTLEGLPIKLSGHYSIVSNESAGATRFTLTNTQHVLFEIGQEQLFLDAQLDWQIANDAASFSLAGDFYIKNEGKIEFEIDDVNEFPPYVSQGSLVLSGDKKAAFEFGNPYLRYVEDSDNDGTYDVGAYYSDVNELMFALGGEKQLVALADLSLPPTVNSPYPEYYDVVNTTTPLVVSPGYYADPDTPESDLQISYRWYINDVLVDGETSNVLPARIAVFGDSVRVSMVVSDGPNSIESQTTDIYLEDAPAEVRIADLPEDAKSGDIVQFVAELSDPDTGAINAQNSLISAPSGAAIDENGLVTWQVPSDFLFSFQRYEFTFGVPQQDGTYSDIQTISLHAESDKAFPIVRSGIEVPSRNRSMVVGDFDGDGNNKILSTDNRSRVFLLEYIDGQYEQTWVYPFSLPTAGNIVEVTGVNIDDDNELEIIVTTTAGVSVIGDLQSLATVLFETDSFIHGMDVGDPNNNGELELAYISSESDYFYEDSDLTVISMSSPEVIVFTTNVSSAQQAIFAQVDEDAGLELVLNNGLVYDAATWSNQWLSSSQFGDSLVTAGDYNGDGIEEIVGANTWGTLAVFSAVDRSQLDSFDNFNTCSLQSADVNNDGVEELLVGDCQWGNITAYQLTNNALSELWSQDMLDHGSSSITVGDSDNDGLVEVHWGTGTSSSGANIFATADTNGDAVSIKENANAVQLGSFSAAGWGNISDNEERAVFYVPSTQSGYSGSRVLVMDDTGQYDLSEEISSNWDNSSVAVTTDFNNDGIGDIFVPNTSFYDGSFAAIQLSDFSTQWQTAGDFDSTIGVIKASDLNGDGYDDAIYADGLVLRAMDVENQLVIGNYSFSNWITDFTVLRKNDVGIVLASFNERVVYLTLNGSSFSEQSFVEQSCYRMELINYDTDDDMELACLGGERFDYSQQVLIIYEIGDTELTEVKRSALSDNIIDFVIDPSATQQQSIFVTTEEIQYVYDQENSYYIKKVNSNGINVWSSPALIGLPTAHGFKVRLDSNNQLEMLLSTDKMMYWIKQ